MLSAADLWFRYHARSPWVLADVSLDVAPGEVVGLWGPSGCGKSTLGAIAGGILSPVRGRVEVEGRPLSAVTGPRPVQVVLQHADRAMNPRWRIRELLAEAGDPDAVDPALVDPHWSDRFPHEISGGELQRVNLERALLVRPAYLVADEISSSLDPITQAVLWHRVLGEVRDRDLGVLAISHDRALLDRVADRVVDAGHLHDSAPWRPAPQSRG